MRLHARLLSARRSVAAKPSLASRGGGASGSSAVRGRRLSWIARRRCALAALLDARSAASRAASDQDRVSGCAPSLTIGGASPKRTVVGWPASTRTGSGAGRWPVDTAGPHQRGGIGRCSRCARRTDRRGRARWRCRSARCGGERQPVRARTSSGVSATVRKNTLPVEPVTSPTAASRIERAQIVGQRRSASVRGRASAAPSSARAGAGSAPARRRSRASVRELDDEELAAELQEVLGAEQRGALVGRQGVCK